MLHSQFLGELTSLLYMMTVELTFEKCYQLELTQDLNDVMIMYCMLPPVESLGSDRKVCVCVSVNIYVYIYI